MCVRIFLLVDPLYCLVLDTFELIYYKQVLIECVEKDENVIFDEEEDVLEMYFIVSGTVGVGFKLY